MSTEIINEEKDGGFYGYVPQGINLGGGLVAGAAVAIVFAYGFLLPLFVKAGNRHEARRKAAIMENTFVMKDEHEETNNEQEGPSIITTKAKKNSKVQNANDTHSPRNERLQRPNDKNAMNNDDDDDDQSILSRSSSKSSSTFSSAVAAILDQPSVPRTKTQRRQRRIKEKQILEEGLQNQRYSSSKSLKNDPNNNGIRNSDDLDPALVHLLQAIHPGAMSQVSNNNHKNPPDPPGIVMEEGEEGVDLFFDTASRPDFGATLSASGKNQPSQQQAHHAFCSTLPGMPAEEFSTMGALDKIATIASWDVELKRIIRLGTPYCTQALITGLTDTLNVAVIGKLIGTREVSAYVVVNLLVEMTSEFVGGFHQALASLCSQAIGANNKFLAGQYVQIATVLYSVCFIPFMIIWAFYMGDALRWFGFDEITVEIGKQYNYILIVDLLMDGVGESIHGLLDVSGYEKFSTLIGASEEVIAFVSILLAGLFGQPTLITVGLLQFGIGMVFFIANIVVIYWKGWFEPYQKGMTGSFAFSNGRAVSLVCRTALSLSFGMLLTDGEWEILTILASFMGPAEVSAWAILDTIWSGTHELIDGIANASEVRCAFLLGNDQPYRARLSAYKSMMVVTFAALLLTSLIYSFGDDLPTWLTNDPALQHILRDLLPLFGLANFVKSVDKMSWTLVGSQGRYRLATFVCCLTSWIVTIPLAVLFTICFKVNLDGLLTAFITGYLVMGVAHAYVVLLSDWPKLSRNVMEENEAEALRIRDEVPNKDNTTNSTTSRRQPSQSVSSVSAVPGGLTLLPMEIASSGPSSQSSIS